jgi:hypothetical protein
MSLTQLASFGASMLAIVLMALASIPGRRWWRNRKMRIRKANQIKWGIHP